MPIAKILRKFSFPAKLKNRLEKIPKRHTLPRQLPPHRFDLEIVSETPLHHMSLLCSKQNQPHFQLNQLSWSNLSELRHANGTRPSFNSAHSSLVSLPPLSPLPRTTFFLCREFVRSLKRSRPAPDACTVVARPWDRYSTSSPSSPLIIHTIRFIYTRYSRRLPVSFDNIVGEYLIRTAVVAARSFPSRSPTTTRAILPFRQDNSR